MKSSSWLLSEGSRLNFELQLSSKCVQSIGLRVIWECWVRQLWRTLFLSWLWVLERDRAPLITCWCTGLRIQNLFALRWSQTIREGRTWSPLTLRGRMARYTRAGFVSGSTQSCLSFIQAVGAPRWTLSMELACQLPGFWWAELLAEALLLFIFKFVESVPEISLRFHPPRLDEEYGDGKYHYFVFRFFLTTVNSATLLMSCCPLCSFNESVCSTTASLFTLFLSPSPLHLAHQVGDLWCVIPWIPGILNPVRSRLSPASSRQKQRACRLTASLTGTDLSQFSGLNVFLHPALESGWNFFWIGTFKERWCVAGRWTASFQQTFPQTHTYALVDIGLTQGLTHPSFLPSNYRKCIQPIRVEALIQ